MIDSAIRKENISESWNGDPAAELVGICKSDADNGSVHHDRDIYGFGFQQKRKYGHLFNPPKG